MDIALYCPVLNAITTSDWYLFRFLRQSATLAPPIQSMLAAQPTPPRQETHISSSPTGVKPTLNILKQASVESDKLWRSVGKPRDGPIFTNRQSCRLKYRKCLKDNKKSETEH